MKTLRLILLITLSLFILNSSQAQNKQAKNAAKAAAVKAMVESQNFDFVAQYANPQGGGQRYLTSYYNLKIKKDSLVAYLPYFGKAYFDVPYNPTDGGIKFTSTKFAYSVIEKKKGGWYITISPADVKYYQRIIIYVSKSGTATASFNITNKSFISFDGYIEENKTAKQ